MAHALEYEFAYGDYRDHESLTFLFETVMSIIGEVLLQEQFSRSNIYTDQGVQNKHECWAESVEVFFDNPADLFGQYQGLYEAVKLMFHQDPLMARI